MNASTARLFPIETCRFVFPSSLLLMGAVVITACRPSGISGLILVPTPQATGSFCVSPGFITRGKTYHGGIPSNYWNMYGRTPEKGQKCVACVACAAWVDDSGALNFNTLQRHLHTVIHCDPLWSTVVPPRLLHQQKRRERCVTELTVTAKKSIEDNQECSSIVTKYHRLVFCSPPLSVSVYLSAALMRFHENSEMEQVGVVAPGARTAKPNRMRMQQWRIFVICVSAACKHCGAIKDKTLFANTCGLAHTQKNKFSITPYALTNIHVLTDIIRLVNTKRMMPLIIFCPFHIMIRTAES